MLIGYARVEAGQKEADQRAALERLGVDSDQLRIDLDLRARAALPARAAMLDELRPGDVVVVAGLERLAYSAADLAVVATAIKERKACLRIGETVYDPTTETGRVAFDLLTRVFRDFESGVFELRLSGPRKKAKEAGRYPGGKALLTADQRAAMFEQHEQGASIADLQDRYGLSQSGVYKYLQRERSTRPGPSLAKGPRT